MLNEHTLDLFSVELPGPIHVRLQPLIFDDMMSIIHMKQQVEKQIAERIKLNQNYSDLENEFKNKDLCAIIHSANGITDKAKLLEWINILTSPQKKCIYDKYKELDTWGYKIFYELTCKDCGQVYNHNLELDPISFFSG